MALRMMSAMGPGSGSGAAHSAHCSGGGEEQADRWTAEHKEQAERDKAKLAEELLTAAKRCHRRFGGKAELATESEQCVLELCSALERILGHGLLQRGQASGGELAAALRHVSELVGMAGGSGAPSGSSSFWPCVREQLTWHERERFGVLRKVQTERGRGRAWLRAALNERSLENHLHSILGCAPSALLPYYHRWAFLLDQDKSSMLPSVAAGLTTILFAIRIDNEELDLTLDHGCSAQRPRHLPPEPIINPQLTDTTSPRVKLRKKVHAHVISFDDEAVDADDDAAPLAHQDVTRKVNSLSVVCESPSSSPLQNALTDASQLQACPQTNDVILNVESLRCQHKEAFEERLLTPLTDSEVMGGLMPISPNDNALDDILTNLPSYLQANGTTEAAVEATEPFISTCTDGDTLNVEALKLRLLALNEIAEQSREEAISSKLQLARFQRQHQNCIEKHELQIQTLNRENELLRQQLRKYVTAVQLLKENSATNTAQDSPSGCHKESEQYQKKLIQVAEMHAELMEFNSRLTLQLNNKDRLVKLLQAELECLRGPINEEDVSTETPFLIHIWIPSAFLTGQTSDIHHVYQIYIRIRDTEWNIYRRYAQFYALYKELKKQDSVVTSFEFPPKKTIGNKDARFVEDRRRKLQQWLRRIVNRLSHCSGAFSSNPTKQTLVTLLPFFGDVPHNLESRRNNSSGNTYSSSSSQYMGL